MTVLISGYLPSGNDESLKYEKTVPFEYISQVMEVMRWKKGENIEGEINEEELKQEVRGLLKKYKYI